GDHDRGRMASSPLLPLCKRTRPRIDGRRSEHLRDVSAVGRSARDTRPVAISRHPAAKQPLVQLARSGGALTDPAWRPLMPGGPLDAWLSVEVIKSFFWCCAMARNVGSSRCRDRSGVGAKLGQGFQGNATAVPGFVAVIVRPLLAAIRA